MSSSSGNIVAADVADRALSDEARRRVANKAQAESMGRPTSSAATAQLPIGFIVGAAVLVVAMLYLTVKFS